MRVRTKVRVYDAWQWNGEKTFTDAPEWVQKEVKEGRFKILTEYVFDGTSSEGKVIGQHNGSEISVGDYLLRGEGGGVTTSKKWLYDMCYEPVEE